PIRDSHPYRQPRLILPMARLRRPSVRRRADGSLRRGAARHHAGPIAVVVGCAGTFDIILPVPRLPTASTPLVSVPCSAPAKRRALFGGCAFNIAVTASVLGTGTAVISPVGRDFDPSGYREHLVRHRVDVSGLIKLPLATSSCAFLI